MCKWRQATATDNIAGKVPLNSRGSLVGSGRLPKEMTWLEARKENPGNFSFILTKLDFSLSNQVTIIHELWELRSKNGYIIWIYFLLNTPRFLRVLLYRVLREWVTLLSSACPPGHCVLLTGKRILRLLHLLSMRRTFRIFMSLTNFCSFFNLIFLLCFLLFDRITKM